MKNSRVNFGRNEVNIITFYYFESYANYAM